MSKKRYLVEIPVTGKITAEVVIDGDGHEAVEAVMDISPDEAEHEPLPGHIDSYDFYYNPQHVVVEGNVFHGELDRAYAELIEQEEDEE